MIELSLDKMENLKTQDEEPVVAEESGEGSILLSLWRKAVAGPKSEKKSQPKAELDEEPEADAEAEAGAGPAAAEADEVPADSDKTPLPPYLRKLYGDWMREYEDNPDTDFSAEDLFAMVDLKPNIFHAFLDELEERAKNYVLRAEEIAAQNRVLAEGLLPEGSSEEELDALLGEMEMSPPMDAEAVVLVAPNWSKAWCMVLPPLGGGAGITQQQIVDQMSTAGVVFGQIEKEIIRLSQPGNAFRLLLVAQGIAPVPGENGTIIDYFPRTVGTPYFIENAQGIVDFNNLNWLVPIQQDAVISKITPPLPGQDGVDIRNRTVKARVGRFPQMPMGENTYVSEDGLTLHAKITGQIAFKNERFHVSDTIVIPGDVDMSVGNLDVQGNLIIRGNVPAGFTIQARGDITVGGTVEGSQITAGGSIIVNHGMSGNVVGTLIAGKDIHSKYLENATARADGDIYMDSIVNCEVHCNGKVVVRSGRGVIIGGHIMAMRGIEANIIGNKAGRLTTLSLGATPRFILQKEYLNRELDMIEHELNQLKAKNKDKKGSLELKILQMKQRQLLQRMDEIRKEEKNIERASIQIGKLYPIVQVTINGNLLELMESYNNCRIYMNTAEKCVAVAFR